MPHVAARILRMAQSRPPTKSSADKNISTNATRVTVKTAGKQQDFMVADDTSVRQFKEKLAAHFKCQMEQLVLVFKGRLLRDHDMLRQRGILDGHTVHLVIKSQQGSQLLARSAQNMSTSEPRHWDGNTKGNRGEMLQPAGVSQAPVKSSLPVKPEMPKVNTQNLEAGCPGHTAQMLDNPSIQQLLSNTDLLQQIISGDLEMQQLTQQNPEVSHILDNYDTLWQTLELARNLAVIQEIMQVQQTAQNLEHPQSSQPYQGLEKIPDGDNSVSQSYTDFKDQVPDNLPDTFGVNFFTALLSGQASEQVQSSPSSPPSSQERRDQLPQLPTTRVIYTSSRGLSSANATPSKVKHSSGLSAAAISTKSRSNTCTIQQPVVVPAQPSTQPIQQHHAEGKDDITPSESSQRLENDMQLSDEQSSSQLIGSMTQLLMNNPCLAAQMMLFMSMPQLSDQWRQQMPEFLLQTQLFDMLVSLANPKASQAILQIEQGLQLLATEAPSLLSWIAPYLWGLGWLPAPSCSYPDITPLSWNVPGMANPERPEDCHNSGAVLQKLQSLAEEPSQSLQTPEIHFSKQMESLQAMGFGDHHANLQALIATKGDTSAAIRKLKRSQGF